MEHYTLTWAFHDANPERLQPGDHIYKWRSPAHANHAIVVECESATETEMNADAADRIKVIRLPCSCCGNALRAEKETLRSFEERCRKLPFSGGLKVARYGVSGVETWVKRYGTCYAVESSPSEEVLQRVETLVNEDTPDRVRCEHLAFWCKTGIWQPKQIDGTRRAVMCSLGAAACASVRLHPAAGVVALVGGGLLRHVACRPQSTSTLQAEELSEEEILQQAQDEASPQDEDPSHDADLDEYVVLEARPGPAYQRGLPINYSQTVREGDDRDDNVLPSEVKQEDARMHQKMTGTAPVDAPGTEQKK
jgi:hypothetical protein